MFIFFFGPFLANSYWNREQLLAKRTISHLAKSSDSTDKIHWEFEYHKRYFLDCVINRKNTKWTCRFITVFILLLIISIMLIIVAVLPLLFFTNLLCISNELSETVQVPCWFFLENWYSYKWKKRILQLSSKYFKFLIKKYFNYNNPNVQFRTVASWEFILQMATERPLSLKDQIVQNCSEFYPWRKIRLPSDLYPTYYLMRIQPNLTTLSLTGSITVTIKVCLTQMVSWFSEF